MKKLLIASMAIASLYASQAHAFCGFYVAKADTKIFNEASKVAVVRDEDRTVITMANDFQGEAKDFAMVIPVPVKLEREQIHVTENALIEHLDAYTAPRLVEYHDENPCQQYRMMKSMAAANDMAAPPVPEMMQESAKSLGVTIEAEYQVEEYDILILSAKESNGLATWLTENGYKIPDGAEEVLGSYIKQKTRFFVAKINLEKHQESGRSFLRPLQIAFESPKFMLPIRLGTVNAKDTQELFVFMLTRTGRVETSNYRTVKIPTDLDIPTYIKDKFSDFYKSMFETAVKKEDMKAVFLEYAWDMNWCDPCAADPLSDAQLRELGVFWTNDNRPAPTPLVQNPNIRPTPPPPPRRFGKSAARDVFITRLHLRYTGETFPEDLQFQHTKNRENFQGRYVMRHAWTGKDQCQAATDYRQNLPTRFEKEAQNLANITRWDISDIRDSMESQGQSFDQPTPVKDDTPWWKQLWPDNNDK